MISAGVAGCIQNEEPRRVLQRARRRFRGIPFDRLRAEDLSTGLGASDLSALSEPSELGGVDAFVPPFSSTQNVRKFECSFELWCRRVKQRSLRGARRKKQQTVKPTRYFTKTQ